MPSLTANVLLHTLPKRNIKESAVKTLHLTESDSMLYFSVGSTTSLLSWALKWQNYGAKCKAFYFLSRREKERSVFYNNLAISLYSGFSYWAVYKFALHKLLNCINWRGITFQTSLALGRHFNGLIMYYTFLAANFAESHEKFFGPRITIPFEEYLLSVYDSTFKKFLFSLFFLERIRYTEVPWYICPFRQVGAEIWKRDVNFMPLFFQFGFVFPVTFSLLKQMTPLGYYLYFYSELLRPYFSYKKIYTINWP